MKLDNIEIKKLLKQNMAAVVVFAICALLLVVYLALFMPLLKTARVKYVECKSREGQVRDARDLIAFARGIDKKFGNRTLISEKESVGAINELVKHGESLGINIISISPRDIIKKEGTPYNILPIGMELAAPGKEFADFLGSLDELQKALLKVKSFDISRQKNDKAMLNIHLELEMYLSSGAGYGK